MNLIEAAKRHPNPTQRVYDQQRNALGAQAPQRPAEASSALDRLNAGVDRLEQVLTALEKRLGPVLAVNPPPSETVTKGDAPYTSPLAQAIHAPTARLTLQIDRVTRLLRRLEI